MGQNLIFGLPYSLVSPISPNPSDVFIDDYSTNEVQVLGLSDLSTLKGRNIIVIEDMVDTGKSMKELLNLLSKYEPNSVKGKSVTRTNPY